MPVDSIAALTQLASTRAIGLVFDEVAVNTKMLQELEPKRKIPAVLKVMAGSLSIKMLVIPAALALNVFFPGAIVPLLTFGGLHLATEGFKSLKGEEHEDDDKDGHKEKKKQTAKEFEKESIKKVLVIDGLLSVEITVMTLPIIAGVPVLAAGAVLALTGLIRTSWMYTVIGSIINMPRAGEWLAKTKGDGAIPKAARAVGQAMGKAMPYIIKGFSIAGTAALLTIGGGLLIHGIPGGEHFMQGALNAISSNGIVQSLVSHVIGGVAGIAAGFVGQPVLDRLYSAIGKGVKAAVKLVKTGFTKKPKKPANDDRKPAPAAAPALQNMPDAKAALNAAGVKQAEQPAPADVAAPKKAEPPKPAA